jgi:hypothetical protein
MTFAPRAGGSASKTVALDGEISVILGDFVDGK